MPDITSANLTIHPENTLFGTVAVKGNPFILVRMNAESGGLAIHIEAGNGVDNDNGGISQVLRLCADLVDTADEPEADEEED